jgi:WD40 repeat protein/serine/threonine protein kinase
MNTPAPSTTCEVFISYASQDADRVVAIAQLLETAGVSVWRDGERILGGQYYGEQIVHALAQSRVVLLMCSPKSLGSDNVHREVLLAWEWGARHYVPVWITPPTDIPERFRYCLVGCQWVDTHAQTPDQWLPRLLSALESHGVHATGSTKEGDTGIRSPSTSRGSEAADRKTRFQPGDRPIPGADWELLTLLGKGGFGEVWKAHNPQLTNQPPVALKFCLRLDERGRELLRHEADMVLRVQQQLKSERVVPLLHAYLNNDPPCLEYPYVEGGTLVQFIEHGRQGGVKLEPDQVEVVIRSIAKVVGAAHRATPKLVHRDLKPANVLVERRPDGKRLLRVTDFGIGAIISQPLLEQARTSSSLQANMASVLTGAYTPLYASPQQIRGDKPDPRDDVYSLGVIWYQLLTSDLTSPAPTGRMWSEPLRRGGMTDAAIDLLASCFESDPAYRPADAGVLAERLMGLVQSGAMKRDSFDELPFVVPIDQPERPPRALTPKSGPQAILHVVPVAEPILKVQPTGRSPTPPPTRKGRPAAPTVRTVYPLPESSGREPQRRRMPRPSRRLWPIFTGIAAFVLLSTLVGLWAGGAFRWETKRGDEPRPPPGDERRLGPGDETAGAYDLTGGNRFVHFGPAGTRVVLEHHDEKNTTFFARVYDLSTGQALSPPLNHKGYVWGASFSPDGRWVVTASGDNTARVWDAATGEAISPPLEHRFLVHYASFSPDGNNVVTYSPFEERLWEAATGKERISPSDVDVFTHRASFSPDGQRVVSLRHTGAQVWEAATGKEVAPLLNHKDVLSYAAFSADGKRIVTGNMDKTARVWDAVTSQPISPPLQHQDYVWYAMFSPDGQRVVTASKDKTARVWDATTGEPLSPPLEHKDEVEHATFSRDGLRVITASEDGTARVWDAATGEALTTFPHGEKVRWAVFSPDGNRAVTVDYRQTARLWDTATGQELKKVTAGPD